LALYAQAVVSLGKLAAESMATRFITRSPRYERAMEACAEVAGRDEAERLDLA